MLSNKSPFSSNTLFLNEDLDFPTDTNGYEDVESGISYSNIIFGNLDFLSENSQENVRHFNNLMEQFTRYMWVPKEHEVIFEANTKFNNNQIF